VWSRGLSCLCEEVDVVLRYSQLDIPTTSMRERRYWDGSSLDIIEILEEVQHHKCEMRFRAQET